jgi:hypothetical protein
MDMNKLRTVQRRTLDQEASEHDLCCLKALECPGNTIDVSSITVFLSVLCLAAGP